MLCLESLCSHPTSAHKPSDPWCCTTVLFCFSQWDAPNAWAPLQWFVVEGMRRANTPAAQALADSIVCRWLKSMYEAYTKTGYMYEKYDALVPGQGGGGGEYVPQRGECVGRQIVHDHGVNHRRGKVRKFVLHSQRLLDRLWLDQRRDAGMA
jgi:neutral trehalase